MAQPVLSRGYEGIDLSPALFDCLGLFGNRQVEWRFVDKEDIPQGPWREIITTRGVSFE